MWAQFSALRSLEHHVIDTTGHAPSETLTAVRAAVETGTFLLRRNPLSGAARGGAGRGTETGTTKGLQVRPGETPQAATDGV